MGNSLEDLVRDLQRFEGNREMTKILGKAFRKPIPPIRKAIRARALATLPSGGGLNAWVAKASVLASIKLSARAASVKLKGTRKSGKGKADLNRLDAGMTRHPSWGRRAPGNWHTQRVPSGYFTTPAGEIDAWRDACNEAVAEAAEAIAHG